MRLFIAVPVAASPEFSLATRRLRDVFPDARSTAHHSWHITLRFLGDVDDPQPVAAGMHSAVADIAAIPARVRGVGAFPNPGAARVAWPAVEAPGLATLAERIRNLTSNMGRPPGDEVFVPHVTLARMKQSRDLADWIERHRNTLFFEGELQNVVLFSSQLTKRGPVYRAESVAKLG